MKRGRLPNQDNFDTLSVSTIERFHCIGIALSLLTRYIDGLWGGVGWSFASALGLEIVTSFHLVLEDCIQSKGANVARHYSQKQSTPLVWFIIKPQLCFDV